MSLAWVPKSPGRGTSTHQEQHFRRTRLCSPPACDGSHKKSSQCRKTHPPRHCRIYFLQLVLTQPKACLGTKFCSSSGRLQLGVACGMSSFSDAGNVSFHTDTPGVTMSRAPLKRATQLDAVGNSPGPAAYADAKLVRGAKAGNPTPRTKMRAMMKSFEALLLGKIAFRKRSRVPL